MKAILIKKTSNDAQILNSEIEHSYALNTGEMYVKYNINCIVFIAF